MIAGSRNFELPKVGVNAGRVRARAQGIGRGSVACFLALGAMCVGPGTTSAQSVDGAESAASEESPASATPWADATLADLSLREKIGQIMMPQVSASFTPYGTEADTRILDAIERHRIGAVIVTSGSPVEAAVMLNRLQMRSDLPLLVGADLEAGAGFRFDGIVRVPGFADLGGATTLPSMMAIAATGEPQYAYRAGLITGLEARAIGVHMPFAPVLDVNNNPDNPIINTRSFGEDPEQVAVLGALFAQGVQDAGAVATGKHFPGHGDTETDSHVALPVIRVDRDRLNEVELRPFREAIEGGIGAIMSAHLSVPSLTSDESTPSTLSKNVLTDLLRGELGFEGIVVTDAMDMAAIDRRFGRGEAVIRALEAGADIILMPPNLDEVVPAVVRAVESGRLPEARLDESVSRILRLKEALGLNVARTVDMDELHQTVGIPEHVAVSEEIAQRSITLLKNEGPVLPLRGRRAARVLSVTYRRESDVLAGRTFNRQVRNIYPRLRTIDIHRSTDPALFDRLQAAADESDVVVISAYVAWSNAAGTLSVSERFANFVKRLADSGKPHVVIAFGNPYMLRDFPGVRSYMVAWDGSEAIQKAAGQALFAGITVQGKTPTRIPPFFDIGEGITLGRRGR